MALLPLATPADLEARSIDTSAADSVAAFLDAASAAVREAAGAPISRGTVTIDLVGSTEKSLRLPGQPIVSVESVDLDGVEVNDWRLVGGSLWRSLGWRRREPSVVTVEYTCGLEEVPADIVDLVCAMVGAALSRSAEGGYESRGDLVAERIDDYSTQYASDVATRSAGPMELPPLTERRLRNRFGGGAAVLSTR